MYKTFPFAGFFIILQEVHGTNLIAKWLIFFNQYATSMVDRGFCVWVHNWNLQFSIVIVDFFTGNVHRYFADLIHESIPTYVGLIDLLKIELSKSDFSINKFSLELVI